MNPAVLQCTQESLGKVIRKPPLTERLLSKPPFRYLHDVIAEVIRVTDFMKGLYTESELKSDNVKDKEAKIIFLQKAVDVVTMVLGEPLSVKPARVVAGHEPEKTNELLQAIAKCCLSKLSSDDAVRKVLAGEKLDPKGKVSVSKSQDKENRESKEDERKSQKDREERKTSEIRERSTSKDRKEREHVKEEDGRRTEKDRERERGVEKDTVREGEKPDHEKNRGKVGKSEKEKDKAREKDREKGHEKDRRSDGGRGKEKDKDRTKEREKEKGRERDKEQERDRELERRRERTREPERKSKSSEESTIKRPPEGPVGDARIELDKELSIPAKGTKPSAGKPVKRQTKFGQDGRKESSRRTSTGSSADEQLVIASEERGRRCSNKVLASGNTSHEGVASAQGEQVAVHLGMKEPIKRQQECSVSGETIAVVSVVTAEKRSAAEQLGEPEAQSQERGDRIADETPVKVSGEKNSVATTDVKHGESGSDADEGEKPAAVVNGETDEIPPHVTQRRIPRPNSARPAPPRIKRQGSAEIPPPERVSSGKLVSSVIVDKQKEDDDEDEQFVVEEAAPVPPEMPEMETDSAFELDGDEKHGGLVKKILETKKDYEAQQQLAKSTEKLHLSETGRKKEKDLVAKEIEKLRTSIQTVCRSALPLGKIMDYIQEDMDAMQNELQMWRNENKLHGEALLREQSITDSAVEPLRIELTDLEQLIKEQQDKICAVKANILKNEEKIQKMVFSISASSRT
ncbi:TRAF3-interacting protein 1 isoform X2 [Pleurodeles waltl]|uniref:TRAF3-interacting protein 1 isoform X2 n=1 Tax=Pleurodeles waltl TaxID=8319 RepID=UPI0037095847